MHAGLGPAQPAHLLIDMDRQPDGPGPPVGRPRAMAWRIHQVA